MVSFPIVRFRSAETLPGNWLTIHNRETEEDAMPARLKIEPGVRYGEFLVSIAAAPIKGRGQQWRFRCDCGGEAIKRVSQVISGEAVSCGCRRRERIFHGHARHPEGKTRYSPEYLSWMGMKARCSNPKQRNWRWYGGRGMTVHRIDNDGNYEPGNCRWATHAEQTGSDRAKQAAEMLRQGVRQIVIAKTVGLSATRVCQIAREIRQSSR
jgi:hypothetical protein